MANAPKPIVFDDLRGGRNDTDPPLKLPMNQAVEFQNMDWKDATFGRKRGGSTAVSQTGGTAFSSGIQSMARHIPGADETAAELWGVDGAGTPIVKRLTGGTTWANVTVDDAISTRPQDVDFATLNGKLYAAYDSAVDRLHVYDPDLTTPRMRRVGFITPGAVTTANSPTAGAYAAVLRYYRVRWLQMKGITVVRRSEPGTAFATTPSGASIGLIITQPTVAGEGETHWEIEASLDNATWYRVYGAGVDPSVGGAPIPIANTTRLDRVVTTAYSGLPNADPVGTYNRPRSAKYLLSDGNRLLLAGGYESGVGLTTPAAPTLSRAATGSGVTAILHYFRVRWIQVIGGAVVRRSEASANASITPTAGDTITVTRPAVANEGENFWETEVSYDNVTWRVFAGFGVDLTFGAVETAIATTTRLFANIVADVTPLALSPATNAFSTATGLSTIWFTPVLGSSDQGDDERVPETTTQKNRLPLNENDGGAITGLGGPINGVPYAFKYRQVWKLRPTQDNLTPYLPRKLYDAAGCIARKTITVGEDHLGQPALYFLSHRGPYRITFDGAVEYLGRDNEVTWRSMNLAASTVVAHATYYHDLHQWWVWIATGSNNDPDTKMVMDVQRGFPDEDGQIRGGWAKHTGDSAGARCSCLFSNTLGASMSKDLKPYLGRSSGTVILKCDTSDLDDNTVAFQATATTRPVLTASDLLKKVGIGESILVGKAAAQTVSVTINRDFGSETRALSVSLAAVGSETRVIKKVEGSEMGEANVVQMTVGDSAASTATWTLDALITPVTPQEPR